MEDRRIGYFAVEVRGIGKCPTIVYRKIQPLYRDISLRNPLESLF